MNRKRPAPKRNKDGVLYSLDDPIKVPSHISAKTIHKSDEIDVVLIGCGGTGSQILTGLGQIHASLRAMNQQDGCQCHGLRVTVYDPDVVTQFNIGRQLFYSTDIGLNKARCLVGRVNMAYGTNWRAVADDFRKRGDSFNGSSHMVKPDILISCVDTASARRDLHKALWNDHFYDGVKYWLDCGNLATVGQVVLGQPGRKEEDRWPRNKRFDPGMVRWKGQRAEQIWDEHGEYNRFVVKDDVEIRLPCVTELFPDLMDENFDETNEPSCSMVDALAKQSLFVNRMVSAYALDLLWELIREGKVDNQGCYFNLRSRMAQPIGLKVWPVQEKQSRMNTKKELMTQ